MSWLFGGSSSKTTPKDMTPQAFKNLQGPLAGVLGKFIGAKPGGGNALLSGVPQYQGPTSAPIGANEQALLGQLMNGPQAQNAGSADALIGKTLSGGFLPGQAGANPFLDASIRAAQRPTLEGLTETLTRALPGRFTQAGQFIQPQGSSAFDRAGAIASRGAANAMGDIATNMSSGAYEAERGRQQQAVQLSQAQVQSTIQNLQAQALPRLIQEFGIQQGMAQFQNRVNSLLQALGISTGVAAPVVANSGSSSSSNGLLPALGSLIG